MIFELIENILQLTAIVACLYLIIVTYLRYKQTLWSEPLGKRRLAIILVLFLAVSAIKISEDALGGESGPIDRAILLFIHSNVPSTLTWFFEAISFTGSSKFILLLTVLAIIALLCAGRRTESLLVSTSMMSSTVMIYVVKMGVGRARPALWNTEWYWGSSFPSGHTLAVATLATAITLSISRIMPVAHKIALTVAILWILLVAISRLVLGVHWPTDVLAAACIGAFLPLVISIALDLRDT